MKTLSHSLHQLIVFLFFFLILTTPLIWTPATSELFEFPKMVFVYGLTLAIVFLWALRCLLDRQLHLRRSRFDLVFLFFLLSQGLSTVFSIHFRTSLLGYYSRFHGGFLSTLTYIALYYAFITHFDARSAQRYLWAIIASAAISSLYAFPEHFGYAFSCLVVQGSLEATCWIQDIVNRVFGTFGQPNWLAAYLITIFPLIWSQFLNSRSKNLLPKTFLILIQFSIFSTLIFTRSRSGLLGFFASFFLFWITLFLSRKKALIKPFLANSTILALPLLAFGTVYTPSANQILDRFRSTPTSSTTTPLSTPSGTLLETGELSLPVINTGAGTQSSVIREIVWRGALQLFLQHPLLGTGVETFGYAYYNTRPIEHNLVSEWDFIYNKAHNEFLNFAANSGILGLGTYLAIILVFLLTTRPHIKTKPDKTHLHTTYTALFSGFIALAISNFFGFSTVPVGLLFFLYPALAVTLSQLPLPSTKASSPSQPNTTQKLHSTQIILVLLLLTTTGYLYWLLIKYIWADTVYADGKTAESLGNLSQAITHYQQAVRLSPGEPTFYNDLADALSQAAVVYISQDHPETAAQFAQLAIAASQKTLSLNPVHLNFYKTQAGVFLRLTAYNQKFLNQAKDLLEAAAQLAPTDAKITYNLGLIYLDLGDTQTAQAKLEQAVAAKANYEAARFKLAQIYQDQGEIEKARQQYQYILNYIAPYNRLAREALENLPPSSR